MTFEDQVNTLLQHSLTKNHGVKAAKFVKDLLLTAKLIADEVMGDKAEFRDVVDIYSLLVSANYCEGVMAGGGSTVSQTDFMGDLSSMKKPKGNA